MSDALSVREIEELNELLVWAVFGIVYLKVKELKAALVRSRLFLSSIFRALAHFAVSEYYNLLRSSEPARLLFRLISGALKHDIIVSYGTRQTCTNHMFSRENGWNQIQLSLRTQQ